MATKKDKALNTKDRNILLIFAKDNISCPAEEAAAKAAYDLAKPYVLEAVHKVYPPKDMKIMERYGATRPNVCVQFGSRYDHESAFNFYPDDKDIPLAPRYNNCSDREYVWSDEARKALFAYVKAVRAFTDAKAKKLADYRTLVLGSRMFNDVASVWPAVEFLRTKIIPETTQQRALSVLSEDALERIRKDNAGAAA